METEKNEYLPEYNFFDVNYARSAMNNIQAAINTGYCGGTSPFIVKAESILEDKLGRSVRLVSNGTIALEASLRLSGVRYGDRVAVASRSFVATANAILSLGAIPVFIGLDSSGLGICPDILDVALLQNKDIRVVVAAHLYGYTPTLTNLVSICDKHNCVLLEDSAQGFGETHDNKLLGTWGKFGTYSFFSNKTIACGEGGAIVFESASDAQRLDEMRYHGGKIGQDGEFHPSSYGSNWRMNGLSAAVLCSSLENSKITMEARLSVANQYAKKIYAEYQYVNSFDSSLMSKWCTVIRNENGELWSEKEARFVALSLRRKGIAARTGMPWLPNLPHLIRFESIGLLPKKQRGIEILLPSHPGMDSESVERVTSALLETINKLRGQKDVGL